MVTFTALPGGNRNNNGTYNNIGNNGNWWSSTENSTTNAWNRNMNYNNTNVNRNNNNKRNGFSVRCVRDLKENIPMQEIKLHGFLFNRQCNN
ncbi:MAG: FISUMP domain-containing protein [Bacteroidota bacterium]